MILSANSQSRAWSIISKASSHFFRNFTSSGMPAAARLCGSLLQLWGRYNRQFSTAAPSVHTSCKLTATWQLAVFPKVPEYCRSTPTECAPCFGKPVSSMTHTASGSNSLTIRLASRSHTGFQSHGLATVGSGSWLEKNPHRLSTTPLSIDKNMEEALCLDMTDAQLDRCRKRLDRFLVDLLEPAGASTRGRCGTVYHRGR